MSNETTPILPQPPPKVITLAPATNVAPVWAQAVMAVLTLISGILVSPHVLPTPNGGGKVTPNPPAPNPAPVPTPIPPTPTVINITDVNGKQVTGSVDPGTLFKVETQSPLSVLGIAQPTSTSADVYNTSATEMVCTLKTGGSLQIVAYGSGKPVFMLVTCNKGPQPPPTPPTPVPDVSPTPTPVKPVKRNVVIAVVEDGANRPPYIAKILNDITDWNKFTTEGNSWQLYNYLTNETAGKAAAQALTTDGVKTPPGGIVLYDKSTGVQLTTYAFTPSTTINDIINLVNKYTGATT